MAKRKQKFSRDTRKPNNPPAFNIPVISVIIAMYNAERYIGDALNSLLAQTFQNFEVIIVDDCSTDSSCAVVESFVERFNGRLTLTHMEENSGQGSLPRNRGLMFSRGEYVFFMDNDDLLTKTALEEMYTLARKFDADVVYLDGHYDADDDLKEIKPADYPMAVSTPTLEPEDLPERIKRIGQGRYTLPPWDKFVRRKLLVENKISFPHCRMSEDDIWTFGLIFYAKNFLCVPNKVYIRRFSEESIMRDKKTPLQVVNVWLSPILLGLKHLDELMRRHEFFKANPQYRYAVLDMFVQWKFNAIFRASQYVMPADIYAALKREYGDKFGEHDVLIPALATALNTQYRINVSNRQKYQQLAAQAQARIAELDAEIARLKVKE